MEYSKSLHRKLLLTWLIVPVVFIWFSTNYLVGVLRPPAWDQTRTKTDSSVSVPFVPMRSEQTPKISPVTWNGRGMVTLWFDDGWLSQYTIAYPMLSEYSYKAALAVPTKLIGYDAYMSWAQVKRLQSNGWEITSHTRSHDCKLFKKDTKMLENELGGAAEDLKSMNLQYENFVSPCGINSAEMKLIAKKYYLSFRTSEPGYNSIPVDEPYRLLVQTMRSTVTMSTVKGWLEEAAREKKWLIIMFHQIDEDSEYSIKTRMLHDILEEIKRQDIMVVLPTQSLEVRGLENYSDHATKSSTLSPEKKRVEDIGL